MLIQKQDIKTLKKTNFKLVVIIFVTLLENLLVCHFKYAEFLNIKC